MELVLVRRLVRIFKKHNPSAVRLAGAYCRGGKAVTLQYTKLHFVLILLVSLNSVQAFAVVLFLEIKKKSCIGYKSIKSIESRKLL